MRILHLLRSLEDERAWDTARRELEGGHEVTLLLLHDAVLTPLSFEGRVFACRDDVLARGGRCTYPAVDYADMVKMIFDHDRVVSW